MIPLREEIAQIVFDIDLKHREGECIDSGLVADRILAIPEIAEALDRNAADRKLAAEIRRSRDSAPR